jgi:hypothetical protein
MRADRVLVRPTWRADTAALACLTGLIAAVYVLVDAPLYNPNVVDPWVYTALFTNFHFIYGLFWNTYYASRLPWVVPGLLLHRLLPDHAAYFALHAVFFIGGGVAAFLLVRQFLGRLAGFTAYALLLGNQLYYNAQAWNYVDGAVVTYLLAAFAFGTTTADGHRRAASMFAAGFFATAAVATNLFVAVLALGLPLLYLAVNGRKARGWHVTRDAFAAAAGVVVLLVGGGLFASLNGAQFWFLGPQIRAISAIDPGVFRSATYDWVGRTPRLIAPLLLLAVGAFLLPRAFRLDPNRRRVRFALAAYGYLAMAELYFVAFELAGGAPLEYAFYESLQLPAIALGAAAVVYAVAVTVEGLRVRLLLLALAVVSGIAPLLIVYLPDSPSLVGSSGTAVTAAVSVAALVCAGFWRYGGRRSAQLTAGAVVALLAFGVGYATASSPDVFASGASNRRNGNVYDVGRELIAFMRHNGFQRTTPFFWYDQHEASELRELQSLYFYSYTYLGLSMPRIDSDFRFREQLYQPRTIVLLCLNPSCRGGPAALRAHGYGLDEITRRRLSAGDVAVWVRVFRVRRLPPAT